MDKKPSNQASGNLEATVHTDGSSGQSSVFATKDSVAAPNKPSATKPSTFSQRWTTFIKAITFPILEGIQKLTRASALNPKITISTVVLTSVLLMVIGIFTGFELVTDEGLLWTPTGSYPRVHDKWINEKSGFPIEARDMVFVFHAGGADDILTKENGMKIFQVIDAITTLPDYDAVCARDASGTCPKSGVTKFWNYSSTIFESSVSSDQEYIEQISVLSYPDDGTPVSVDDIFGNAQRDPSTGLLTSAQSYILTISFPEDANGDTVSSEEFETKALDVVFDFQEKWKNEEFKVETFAERSFGDEFERAIVSDIPLVPIVFVLMGIFTCVIFFKRDKVQSRSLLGFMSVVSIFLSIMAGYGLMFVSGIPFTSMTQILPFVFFGVGLDDAFIISGSYFRLDPSMDVVDRIAKTMDEIGLSIFITTLTSAIAFGLGCTSNIPAVYWLCLYATPTVILILLFQMTFFVACLVLDERRVAANHRDALRCISCGKQESVPMPTELEKKDSSMDQFMFWLVQKLMLPWVKVIVILAFVGLAAACVVSTTNLQQEFVFTEVVPSDSYITPFFNSFQDYSVRSSVAPFVYFRDVDQSDVEIQKQMDTFVTDLVGIDAILAEPEFCWVRDFRRYVAASSNTTNDITTKSFNEQINTFLSDPLYYELYHEHVVLNENGAVVASRCQIYMDNVDIYNVKNQVKALKDQERVSTSQPINQGAEELKFFTYGSDYDIWEFFYRSSKEIRGTTISSVAAVTFATVMIVPHWSAIFFAFPLICILYIDFLGVLQWAGVKVNPVSYVTLVMAIGLLVDYLLHVLLRYYETPGTRKEKVIEVIRSMGSSVMMGGITTFLGTIPLAFSSSEIFTTVFIAFITLVVLGISHGLILLPVVLSIIGPEDTVYMGSMTETKQTHSLEDVENGKTEAIVNDDIVDEGGEEEEDEMYA